MTASQGSSVRGCGRAAGVVAVLLLGMASIVGSGGGGFDLGNICAGNSCDFNIPTVQVTPARLTVQVGSAVQLSSKVSDVPNPAYQWQRADAGAGFVDIPGATSGSYTLASATLVDDGATFQLEVFNGRSLVGSGLTHLAVSSMPSVAFQDTDFSPADWTATAIAGPFSTGAGHTADQRLSGGNPGAYRHMTFTLPVGPSDDTVVHLYRLGQYVPSLQGAIHVIDYSEDCRDVPVGTGTQYAAFTRLALQQGSRLYAAKGEAFCNSYAWVKESFAALPVSDFVQLSGPACAVGESCPDFSASGPAIQLGFARRAALAASTPAATIEHEIDNWSVHVWRR